MSMKKRTASLLLAILTVVSLTLPALAAVPEEFLDEIPDGFPDEIPEETIVESPEPEEIYSAFLLDGEPMTALEYEMRGGVCYVTVSSFVSMLDAEAMVEEGNGAVTVNASAVIDVVPVEYAGAEIWEAGESEAEYAGAETWEAWEPGAEYAAANVVTADLNLVAGAGEAYLVANGRYLYVKDGLTWLNGRIAAPVRQLARVFNLSVGYDAETGQVLLDHQEGAEPYLSSGAETYDSETLLWLSRIIHAESGNQSLEGKIAVGNVVMNRVNNPKFPNTLYDVLFQKGQFSPAASGSIYKDPNWESQVAAMLVLDGAQVVPDALFFNGAGARSYASKHRTYLTTIGSHDFYR